MSPPLPIPAALPGAFGALALAAGGGAFGAVAEPALPGAASAATASLATLLRLALALAAVLLAFWGCARLMRRLHGGAVGAAAGGELRLVGALSLGQRERLVLVETGGERVLLGVSPSRIERLHSLGRPPSASGEPDAVSSPPASASHRTPPSAPPPASRSLPSDAAPRAPSSSEPALAGRRGEAATTVDAVRGAEDFRARLRAALRQRSPS